MNFTQPKQAFSLE